MFNYMAVNHLQQASKATNNAKNSLSYKKYKTPDEVRALNQLHLLMHGFGRALRDATKNIERQEELTLQLRAR